ncbi:MAG: hypothetical protein GEV08_21390 [Acidimicrobiia bacterium]|nr:hypothetical protein [Acidimicrobiia bacterium]
MTPIQLVLDCADAHAQARFWAAALGYEVEDHHDLITQLVSAGHAPAEAAFELGGRMAWRDMAACRDPEGARPRLLLQRVPEAKVAKIRLHLDLQVGQEARPAEQARLEALGARKLYDGQLGPGTWVTMADPEGNEFCLT